MITLPKPQIIMSNGSPAFAVIPWHEYQELIRLYDIDNDVWIPHEIVKATLLGDVSAIRAWREYFNLTSKSWRSGLIYHNQRWHG